MLLCFYMLPNLMYLNFFLLFQYIYIFTECFCWFSEIVLSLLVGNCNNPFARTKLQFSDSMLNGLFHNLILAFLLNWLGLMPLRASRVRIKAFFLPGLGNVLYNLICKIFTVSLVFVLFFCEFNICFFFHCFHCK